MSSSVPLIAGSALFLAELAFSVLQPASDPKPGALQRIVWAAAAGLGGVVVAALVLLAATPHVGRSLLVTVAGTVAALIAVGLLSRLWSRE